MGVTSRSQPAVPVLEVKEGATSGLAKIVASLLEPAMSKDPRAVAKMRGSLALKVTDRNAGTTLSFEAGQVTVTGSVDPNASVTIEAPLLTLGALGEGSHALRGLLRGEVKVKRGLRHPLLLLRVRRLLQAL